MSAPAWLLTLPVALPLACGVLVLLLPSRWLPRLGVAGACACAGSVAPLLRRVLSDGPLSQTLGGWEAPLGIVLHLDGLAALFLLFAAITGLGISLYTAHYFPPARKGDRPRSSLFWPLWFVTWGGLHSLFLTRDLFNIYVTLELVSIAGVGLILIAGTPGATRAALQYQMQTLIAGLVYLLGVGLMYNAAGTLDLHLLGEETDPTAMKSLGLALMTSGLLIKAALFPMHFWLPRAHADAPAPVSAVLSGLVVTVAFVVLTRIWFSGLHRLASAEFSAFIGLLGAAGILWGGLLALRQQRLKRILAYSTVSQVGYLFLVFALSLNEGPTERWVWTGAVYLAISHGLSKAAAFLAAGYLQKTEGSDRLLTLRGAAHRQPGAVLVLAVASVNLMGLPPSTGFIGKWMLLRAALHNGQWILAGVMLGGGLLAAAYLFRVFECLLQPPGDRPVPANAWSGPPPRRRMLVPAMLLALATLLPVIFVTAPEQLLRIGAPAALQR